MTLIYPVILFLLFKVKSCQLQCVEEAPNVKEFSINVTTHLKVESGDCIRILYELTFPKDKVKVPYKKIWFEGDSQIAESEEVVNNVESETGDILKIDGLPRGEYEYGFRLEWECNQTYIFPERVRISVSALTRKPTVHLPDDPMTEGQAAMLECVAPLLCYDMGHVYWRGTKVYGSKAYYDYDGDYAWHGFSDYIGVNRLVVTPTADDHNTNITCVAQYDYNIIETTVTLTVKFAPKILNGSQCVLQGDLLVCVCMSRGNPPPPITWPSDSLTDFLVSSSSSIQTVTSTITMSAADHPGTTVTCVSTNELGRDEIEIPLRNYTEDLKLSSELDSTSKSDAVVPWTIAVVSLILNLVLPTSLIIYYRRGKSQQKDLGTEMNTYASLNRADVTSVYDVISPQDRYIT